MKNFRQLVPQGLLALLVSLFFLALVLSVFFKWGMSSSILGAAFYFAIPCIGFLLTVAGLFLRRPWKWIIIFNVIIGGVVSVLVEFAVSSYASDVGASRAKSYSADTWDHRAPERAVLDMRASGINVDLIYTPLQVLKRFSVTDGDGDWHSRLQIDRMEVLPLTSAAFGTVLYCNEEGYFQLYGLDELGFNNPKGVWSGDNIDLAIVGDSNAFGYCVPPSENLSARIRAEITNTVNTGVPHSGPLSQLAILREYLSEKRPRIVLWVYSENDLEDLEIEKKFPILLKYLEPGFSQNILRRKAQFDEVTKRYIDDGLKEYEQTNKREAENVRNSVLEMLSLSYIRKIIDRVHIKEDADFELYEEILQTAREEIEGWGGRLVIIYMPSWIYFDKTALTFDIWRERNRAGVLNVVSKNGIPVIDLLSVFRKHSEPLTLFMGPGKHYTVAGYSLAARSILKQISHKECCQ